MTGEGHDTLREKLAQEMGDAPWAMLEAHAKRGGLIVVDPSLDLLDVAVAIAVDDGDHVTSWMSRGLLTGPDPDHFAAGLSDPIRFVIVQPFVLVAAPTDS